LNFVAYFRQNFIDMEAQRSTGKYWFLCFFWLAILITLIVVYREFFWLALPGAITYFCKAMNLLDTQAE
jgi:hypothetical protein